jgi:hypothetical protein
LCAYASPHSQDCEASALQVECSAPRAVTTNVRFKDRKGSTCAGAVNASIYGAAAITERKQLLRKQSEREGAKKLCKSPRPSVRDRRRHRLQFQSRHKPDQSLRCRPACRCPEAAVGAQSPVFSAVWIWSSDTPGKSFAACHSAMSVSEAPEQPMRERLNDVSEKAHAGIAGFRIFARNRNVPKYLPRILGRNCQ